MKKCYYLSFLFLIAIVFFIYGCCSNSGGGGVSAIVQGDASDVVSKTVCIDDEGRLPTITFPSGAIIEAAEKNTLVPGVYVTVTEQKLSSTHETFFKDFTDSNHDFYAYKIVAALDSSNKKTYATTVEKPFTITLPNTQSETGLCYIGIRNSETDPWRFCRVDDGSSVVSTLRASSGAPAPKQCTFKLHRLGLSFALVVYNGNPTKNLPETAVDSLVASSAYNILVKNGKYLEDLEIKGILKGVKVNSLNPSDFIARITYRNNNSHPSSIKVNGDNVVQTTNEDKTVPNYSYSHSFEVTTVSDSLLMNTEGEFVINLNLNNVDASSFASGFLIEFYNKIDSDKILPYVYTDYLSVAKVESIKITLNPVESDIVYKDKNLFKLNPTFKITSSYDFNESDKKKIADALNVSSIESSNVEKKWNGKDLVLSFSKNLEPETSYTISLPSVNGLNTPGIETFSDFSFKTVGKYCDYTVVHQKENIDGSYKVEKTEKLTVLADSNVVPDTETYQGFESPEKQSVKVEHGSENIITYNYPRKVFNFEVIAGTGIKEVSGSGRYKYGAHVVASYTLLDGYVFRNWTGEKTDSEFIMPEKDVTMQANAIEGNPADGDEVYVITYVLNGGHFTEESYPKSFGEKTESFSLIAPIKDGCKFRGWTTLESAEPQLTVTVAKGTKGDKVFIADWEYESYHLTLQKGEGIASVTGEDDYLYTAKVIASCTMLEGYEFDSWTGDQTVGTFNMSSKAITMKANAKPINYQIVYQNVSDDVNNPTSYNVNSDAITLVNPSRDGYDFVGWTEVGNNALPAMTLTIPQGSTGERTYKANWVETIIYDLPNGQKLQLNRCIADSFVMGSPFSEVGRNEEEVQHNVRLTNTFYMGKFEITQAQYRAIMGINPSAASGDDTSRPVENVTWEQAMTFCERLNEYLAESLPPDYYIILPTEAMWEYACRAGSTAGLNSNANINAAEGACSNLDVLGWYKSNSGNQTHPVGQKQPNAWGLYDMHGNVWEWCLDYYDADFYRYMGDCTDPLNQDDWYDPPNVFRGGSFDTEPQDCRSATRIDHVRFPTSSGGGGYVMEARRSINRRISGSSSARGANIGFRVCLMCHSSSAYEANPK